MAEIFLGIYDLSCSAILQCFLIDEEMAQKNGLNAGKHRPASLEHFFEGIRSAVPENKEKRADSKA